MKRDKMRRQFATVIAIGLTAFLAASLLFGLLLRLKDHTGASIAGWVAVLAGGLTLAAVACSKLVQDTSRLD
jgi:hypothetical protein